MTKDGAPEGGSTCEVVDCGNVQVRVVAVPLPAIPSEVCGFQHRGEAVAGASGKSRSWGVSRGGSAGAS